MYKLHNSIPSIQTQKITPFPDTIVVTLNAFNVCNNILFISILEI